MNSHPKVTGIACGIFKSEIGKLCSNGAINIHFRFLDSMLHLTPPLLSDLLCNETQNTSNKYILVYGDCCPVMNSLLKRKNIIKVTGINCCEILLGETRYKKLQSEQTFILLHEWVSKFEDIFIKNFGFNTNNIKNFFREMHNKIVFLDTGVFPINYRILDRISELTGLEIEIEKTELNIMATAINTAVKKLLL